MSDATAHLVFGWDLGGPYRWHIAEVDEEGDWTGPHRLDLAEDFEATAHDILLRETGLFTEDAPYSEDEAYEQLNSSGGTLTWEQLVETPEYQARDAWLTRKREALAKLPVQVESFGYCGDDQDGVTYFLVSKSLAFTASIEQSQRINPGELATHQRLGPEEKELMRAASILGITPIRPTGYGQPRGTATASGWLLATRFDQ